MKLWGRQEWEQILLINIKTRFNCGLKTILGNYKKKLQTQKFLLYWRNMKTSVVPKYFNICSTKHEKPTFTVEVCCLDHIRWVESSFVCIISWPICRKHTEIFPPSRQLSKCSRSEDYFFFAILLLILFNFI